MLTRDGYPIIEFGQSPYPNNQYMLYARVWEPPFKKDGTKRDGYIKANGKIVLPHFSKITYHKELNKA